MASPASIVLTGVLVGLILESQRQRAQRRGDLIAAVSAFCAAIDGLVIEIQQLPRQASPRSLAAARWLERKVPLIDFTISRLAKGMFGRELYQSIHRVNVATNRLGPIAPPRVAAKMLAIFELLENYGSQTDVAQGGRERWLAEVREARDELGVELGRISGRQGRFTRMRDALGHGSTLCHTPPLPRGGES